MRALAGRLSDAAVTVVVSTKMGVRASPKREGWPVGVCSLVRRAMATGLHRQGIAITRTIDDDDEGRDVPFRGVEQIVRNAKAILDWVGW